jgi:GT2 family glycosyltransferase
MAARPEVTVLVPTVGRGVLEQVLGALARGTVLPGRLVIVDQGPSPVPEAWLAGLRDAGVEILRLAAERRGPSAARNRGLEAIEGGWVAALDDDCVPDLHWLERLLARLEEYPGALVTGRVEGPPEGEAPSTVEEEEAAVYRRPVFRFDPLSSGNMGFDRAVARRVGAFDEGLWAAEDNDWAYRALRRGIPVVYAPEVRVLHLDWRSGAELDAVYRRYAHGQGAFYGKYLRRGDVFIALRALRDLLRCPRRWLLGRLSGDAARARSGRAYTLGLLPGLWAGFRGNR